MQVGISNIVWPQDMVRQNSILAKKVGYDYIESAYLKVPQSISVYAVQSLFFESIIKGFDDPYCYSYLRKLISLCSEKNIKIITFGSPGFRKGNKEFMLDLLARVDRHIEGKSCIVCIEPNAREYGAEYYYNLQDIINDISQFKNIKTMIDTGNLIMEKYDVLEQYEKYKDYIHHIHISEPYMAPIKDFTVYSELISLLKNNNYRDGITYECISTQSNLEYDMKIFLDEVWNNGMEAI